MKLFCSVFLCLCCLCCLGKSAEAKEWEGITPLHSARSDVERGFGVTSSGKFVDHFTFKTDRVFLEYSEKQCEKDEIGLYDVPVGTVLSISVTPMNSILLSSLRLDLSKFKVEHATDVGGMRFYADREDGFIISVYEDQVTGFTYLPTASDSKRLRCTNKAITERPKRPCVSRAYPFDPSGSYYMKPKLESKVDAGIVELFAIVLHVEQEGGKLAASGAVISRVGIEYKFTDVSISQERLIFTTENLDGVEYKFSGRWLITDGVFARDEASHGQVLLEGALERIKKGKTISPGGRGFIYRPEC
ncbi:MAG: hypothetical protein ACRD5H_15430 [Nitrososphaerales archaeon]